MSVKFTEVDRQIVVTDTDYADWIRNSEQPRLRAEFQELRRQPIAAPIKISVLLPTFNTNTKFLKAAIDSVIEQIYPNWQLCLVDDASSNDDVKTVLREYAARDPRIALHFAASNSGIATTTNAALKLADGMYCALLDHDDVLSPFALLRVAQYVQHNPNIALLYSDSDRLDHNGQRIEPFFKPDWNYDLFLGQNYLNHLTVYATDLLRRLNGWREGYEGSQDYDLALRAIEIVPADAIAHVPEILYHWRKVESSFSGTQLGAAVKAARRAIAAHLDRTGVKAEVKACPGALLYNRIARPVRSEPVAIMLYGSNSTMVQESLTAWRQAITEPDVQWSACELASTADIGRLNRWAQHQSTDVVGFIIAGLSPLQPAAWRSWLAHSQRPYVAAVGAKYVTSEGVVLGPLQLLQDSKSIRQVAYKAHQIENSGYFGNLLLDCQVAALQTGCVLIRRRPFLKVGGWRCDSDSPITADNTLVARLPFGAQMIWHPFAVVRSLSLELDRAFCYESEDSTGILTGEVNK